MTEPLPPQAAATPSPPARGWRHAAGFLVSGGLAFMTDAAVLFALTNGNWLDPYSARVLAIATAMIVAYIAHRRLTFADTTAPSLRQFAKFASVAMTANAINYAIYAGLLMAIPERGPLFALLIASAVAMAISYAGFRFGVFKRPPDAI